MSDTFLLVCFVCLKESNCETRKNVFYFSSKALFVLEIINFSGIQMTWRHQMPEREKRETRNAFSWITREVNISGDDIWPVYVILQNKIFDEKSIFIKKFHEKCGAETNSRTFFNFQESSVNHHQRRPVCVLIWTNFDSFTNIYLI